MICLVLLCTLIEIGHTRSAFKMDDEDQLHKENPFINNHASLNDRFNGKIPVEDFYYNKKQFSPDDVQLAKRIIMLPRVGRRSIQST
jgi:hypothetical protein